MGDVLMFKSSIIDKRTIKVLDKYIESKEQYFFITDIFRINHKEKIYDINFIISNKIEIGKSMVPTNITMTEFKKIYSSFFNDLEKLVNYKTILTRSNRTAVPKFSVPVLDFLELFFEHFKSHIDETNTFNNNDKIIFFDNPISINAQSSDNRTGYGNEYYYDELVYEGTKYGETSQFPIIGYVTSFNERFTNLHKNY